MYSTMHVPFLTLLTEDHSVTEKQDTWIFNEFKKKKIPVIHGSLLFVNIIFFYTCSSVTSSTTTKKKTTQNKYCCENGLTYKIYKKKKRKKS